MQGAQTESRFRGIGRYSLSLAQAVVRNRGNHEILLVLSAMFPETIDDIRAAFEGMLPQENIRVWTAPGPTCARDISNNTRRMVGERIREAFLADLEPDVVLITSLFEGLGDDAITSVGEFDTSTPVAVILYDLVPLINPDSHFRTSVLHRNWYEGKLSSLKRSKLLLAISESSKSEALDSLGINPNDVVTIFGACDASFRRLSLSDEEKRQVCRTVGIVRPFVMYTGGADERKNLHRLIEAFASLESNLRQHYQLALVGKMPKGSVRDYLNTAKKCGLASDEVVCTGYVEDDNLLVLYNACDLFVFPSLHEGLGFPPLEAMACGAPVISSNLTSLPEVVGYAEAMFDPTSVEAITSKLKQALVDKDFKERLVSHGNLQIKKFSWDESARLALGALSRFDGVMANSSNNQKQVIEKTSFFKKIPKRILLLKLDHMGDFILAIPAIMKLKARYPYATVDIVVGSWNVSAARELNVFNQVYALDFFRKKSSEAPSAKKTEIDVFIKQAGSYDIAIDLRRQKDTRFILVKTDADLKVGYETFDQALDSSLDIKLKAYADIPFQKTPLNCTHISQQILSLVDALPPDINDYICFPKLAERTSSERIEVALFPTAGNSVRQWPKENYSALASLLAADGRIDAVKIFFGSEIESTPYVFSASAKLHVYTGLGFSLLTKSLSEATLCITNNSFGGHIASYVGCTVLALYGGQETVAEWAPAFGESFVIHTAAPCSPCHIPHISDCISNMSCMNGISVETVHGTVNEFIAAHLDGRGVIPENMFPTRKRSSSQIVDDVVESIAALDLESFDAHQKTLVASSIARNHRPSASKRQLLIDITELVHRNARTGIQRTVRALIEQLLRDPPKNFTVELVYADSYQPIYRYARAYTQNLLGLSRNIGDDAPAEAWAGDIFVGLDLYQQIHEQLDFLKEWRQRGVGVFFVVYDLLPSRMPGAFRKGIDVIHTEWLKMVAQFDGAIAISKTVADELHEWLRLNLKPRKRSFHISYFHLGADIRSTAPALGSSDSDTHLSKHLASRPSFLMVGTVEPRKGHALVLAACEELWKNGEEINLIIVGKQGWMVKELVEQLRQHPEAAKRLFWLDTVSDEYLEIIYSECSALIAASEGEGFGLPLVEAAKHGLPIVARDIPAFREVAGEYACYFPDMKNPETLAKSLRAWLALYRTGMHKRSDNMPWLTWKQSAQQLFDAISGAFTYKTWP
jgi:glycosyltransferase involved in cell wall biosynthesis/ADP-heptose:LPS heptosyltransferase